MKNKKTNQQMKALILSLLLVFSFVVLVSSDLWDSRNILYYNFEDSTELVSGTYDLVNNEGVPTYQTDKALIGKSGLAEVNVNWNIPYNDMINWTLGNKSMNFWVRPYLLGDNDYLFGSDYATEAFSLWTVGTDRFRIGNKFGADSFFSPAGVFLNDTWVMITLARNDTDIIYWINGTHKNMTQGVPDFHGAGNPMKIGVAQSNGNEFIGLYDELGFWNYTLNDIDVTELYNSGAGVTRTVTNVLLNLPANNTEINYPQSNFSSNFSETIGSELIWQNASYYIWYSNGSLFNNTNLSIGVGNFTSINISGFTVGDYTWNVYGCSQNTTNPGMRCGWAESNYTFTMGSTVNKLNYNSTTFETSRENIQLNITTFDSQVPTNPILTYNGTNYSMTSTLSGPDYLISANIDVPLTDSLINKTFNFTWNLDGNSETTSNYEQQINTTTFVECNATYPLPYVNFTFKDEATDSTLTNVTIPLATFQYYLGTGKINKTYTYTNVTGSQNYTFCYSPSDRDIKVDPTVQYKQINYPQRIYNPSTLTLGNSSTDKILYLLGSSDGIYVTFQIINTAEQVIQGVDVIAVRNIGGTDVTIGSGLTGADGTVTLWLNPDFVHSFTFSKLGYTTYATSFAPTQSAYTISLSGGASLAGYDYSKGISYIIEPKTSKELNNETVYNFNYTLVSDYWDVSEFGFVLKLNNGTILQSTSATSNGGFLNLAQDTETFDRIIMDYYYVINSTYINYTTYWNTFNTGNTDWSIKNFFEDFNAYFEEGFFGIDEFGKYLLIFLVLFISVGVMSYKFGLVSPVAISSMVFAIVFFFDVTLDLLPEPVNAIPNTLTFISLIIVVVLVFREVQT